MRIDKFVLSLSDEAFSTGHYRKCDVYRSVLGRVCSFCGGVYPSLDEVFILSFLSRFEEYLMMDGLSMNTVSFYMSGLRSIHSAAVAAGKLKADPGLFSEVFTDHVPTDKRAISAESVARLYTANLSANPRLAYCRDLFMASLCLQGIAFVDLLHLRKADLQGNLLTYNRRKTDTQVSVYVLEEAKMFLSRLIDNKMNMPYLLPFITSPGAAGYKQYQSALHLYNEQLKDLADHVGIPETLTSYVARHTWATMAYHNNVPVATISVAMGHRTEEMTHTYLSSLDGDQMQEANQAVWNAVLRPIREGVVPDVREEARKIPEDPLPANAPVQRAQVQKSASAPAQQAQVWLKPENQRTPVGNRVQPEKPASDGEPKEKVLLNRAERRRLEREEKKRMKQKNQKRSVF